MSINCLHACLCCTLEEDLYTQVETLLIILFATRLGSTMDAIERWDSDMDCVHNETRVTCGNKQFQHKFMHL